MKKLVQFAFTALILLSLASTTMAQGKTFDKWGVVFNYPRSWKITEQEEVAPGNFYVSIEKKGEDASGLLMFVWTDGHADLQERLALYENSVSSNIAGAKFGELTEGKFGQYEGIKLPYTFSLMGIEHQANMYCFHAGNQTVVVMAQEANEDVKVNKSGFEQMEKSFKAKE